MGLFKTSTNKDYCKMLCVNNVHRNQKKEIKNNSKNQVKLKI